MVPRASRTRVATATPAIGALPPLPRARGRTRRAAASAVRARGTGGARRRPLARELHTGAFTQPVAAFGDDPLAGLEATGDRDHVAGRDSALHRPDRDGAIVLEHVDEVAVRPGAHRRHRNHDRAVDRAQQQADVDELVREQAVSRIGEARLGLDGAGLDVDLVVQRGEGAVLELAGAGAVPGGDGERRAAADARLDLRHAVLRHRELDVDRVELGDDGDARRVAGADVVADVDRAQADPAVHRRDDPGVGEVEAGAAFVGPVDDQGGLELLDRRGLGVDVLAGDRILAQQGLVALQLHPAVLEHGLVAHARSDRLLQRGLERPRIDGREQLPFLHHLAFGEGDRGDQPRDLRPHRHRDRGDDGAESVEHDRQVGPGRGRHADGARSGPTAAAAARPAGAWPAGSRTRRIGRARARGHGSERGRRGRGRPMRQVPGEGAETEQRDDRDDRTDPAPSGRGGTGVGEGEGSSCGSDRMRVLERGSRRRLTRRGRTRRVERTAGRPGKRHAQDRSSSWRTAPRWEKRC